MVSEIERSMATDVPGEILCYATMYPIDDKLNSDDPLLAYKATSDPDTLYFHQAMKEPDRKEFELSMRLLWLLCSRFHFPLLGSSFFDVTLLHCSKS